MNDPKIRTKYRSIRQELQQGARGWRTLDFFVAPSDLQKRGIQYAEDQVPDDWLVYWCSENELTLIPGPPEPLNFNGLRKLCAESRLIARKDPWPWDVYSREWHERLPERNRPGWHVYPSIDHDTFTFNENVLPGWYVFQEPPVHACSARESPKIPSGVEDVFEGVKNGKRMRIATAVETLWFMMVIMTVRSIPPAFMPILTSSVAHCHEPVYLWWLAGIHKRRFRRFRALYSHPREICNSKLVYLTHHFAL